jgi:hypothetical protein
VVVVTFAPAPLLARFEAALGLDIEYYGDPDRHAYAAFGFGRAAAARVWLDPRVWRRYAALVARGRVPRPPPEGQDTLQLGGDVLTDAEGRVEWVFRSTGPEDRPTVEALLRAGAPPPAPGRAV